MELVEKLWAIDQIRNLKARYFRLMDTKDWEGLRTVFCDDAVFDARTALSIAPDDGDDWWAEGGDAIVEFIKGVVLTVRSTHHGHCHEVTIDGPDSAHGVIAMEDTLWSEDRSQLIVHGTGHYHEQYRRVDGEWKIWRSNITRLDVDTGE